MGAGLDMQSLPDDPEALRALLAATLARCEVLTEERDTLAARNERRKRRSVDRGGIVLTVGAG